MLNNLYINGEIIKHCNNIEKYKQFAKKLLFINTDTKLYKSVINIDNNLYISFINNRPFNCICWTK